MELTSISVTNRTPSPLYAPEEAVAYDAMVHRHFGLLNRPFVEMILKRGPERARVLDIGTGPGWIPIELARNRPGWEIWGVDLSQDMLRQAQRHAEEAGVAERVHFLGGSATKLPFENGHFDMTVSHFMLHHVASPIELFNEAARVTRGGGRILIKDLLRQPAWKAKLLLLFSKYVLRYNRLQMKIYGEYLDAAPTCAELCRTLNYSRLNMARVGSFRGLDFVVEA